MIILSLDTSTPVCSIALHDQGTPLASQEYHLQKSHSSLLPSVIQQVLENCGLKAADIQAVALGGGPGSYTGLRIGASTAKGLCFALGIPLISLCSLDSMSAQVSGACDTSALLCPMLDARRMEVYCQLETVDGEVIWNTRPLILDEQSFDEFEDRRVIVYGSGAEKAAKLLPRLKYVPDIYPHARAMGVLAWKKFQQEDFEDVAYYEPDYLKAYQATVPKNKMLV